MPITEEQWQAITTVLRREVSSHFPEWTESNRHDPGITLIELFAFLAENLLYRANQIGDRDREALAHRLLSVAHAWATTCTDGSAVMDERGLLRVNYFSGQLLGSDDFSAEQNYLRERFRRRNRFLHGVGIVSGLNVSIDRGSGGPQVSIEPGLALDPRGEEIEVRHPISLLLPTHGKALLVQIRYAERLCRPVPATVSGNDPNTQQYSRIEETFDAFLVPDDDGTAVTLGRLAYVKKRWALDRRFKVRRVV
jgi:hypothetical protein